MSQGLNTLLDSSSVKIVTDAIDLAEPLTDEGLIKTDRIEAALDLGVLNGEAVPAADLNLVTHDLPPLKYVGSKGGFEKIASALDKMTAGVDPNEQSVPEGFAAQVIKTVRDRGNAYGSPAENHQTTADLLSSWFSRRYKMDIRLTAEDVIVVNIIQKVSRLANVSKDDSWLDIAGYAENVAMIRPDQRNGAVVAKRHDLLGKTYSSGPAADLEMGRN